MSPGPSDAPAAGPGRIALVAFVLLVVATGGAFFLAQHLKSEPPLIQKITHRSSLSPNGDGRQEEISFGLRLKRSTRVTLEIVDRDARTVATILRDADARAYRRIRATWSGRRDDGRPFSEGTYRLKIVLPDEGRSVVHTTSFALSTRPPSPRVLRVGPASAAGRTGGPLIMPTAEGRPAEATVRLRGWKPTARVVRVSPRPVTIVRRLPVTDVVRAARGAGKEPHGERRALEGKVVWDGTIAGRPAPAGTYVVQVCVRNLAEIEGCGPTARGPRGLPVPGDDGRFSGKGGITVRDLAVQVKPGPVKAGNRMTFFVDARGHRYRWTLRRVGTRRAVDSGTDDAAVLKVRGRSARGAAYLLDVTTEDGRGGRASITVPATTNDEKDQPVLVVLPGVSWQGTNALDDDGDGRPDGLGGGATSRVRALRVLTGLPRGFNRREKPVLEWLARKRKRFEITTDLALALGEGPKIEGRRGVLLVGEHRWVVPAVGAALRRFVRTGGTVAALEPTGLHRSVELRGPRLVEPGEFDPTDALGITSSGSVRLTGGLQIDGDEVGIFRGTDGKFDGYTVGWPVEGREPGRRVAGAVDGEGRVIIAAHRVGRGLSIRTGLPELARRLNDDDTDELLDSVWRRLSR
ncbi:MAG: hypothetical protein AB7G37_03940 [Solirubrobacteraceae bacterium]